MRINKSNAEFTAEKILGGQSLFGEAQSDVVIDLETPENNPDDRGSEANKRAFVSLKAF